ncbi:GMC family oxidoreductase [Pseudorhodoplanes sp.]|uniref:GMC family oxidoreductase n=1 Tax=Pseudorhodoplanes sp. TaxID=1934341 RepID=UPI003D0CEEC2
MDEAAQCKHWDVIVVGGGSAGCVVASELSRIGRLSVLLIEAGRDTPPGAEPASIRDPFYASAMREENFWPDLYVNWISRRLGAQRDPAFYEQARIMGGGSSVNSMVAIRPLPDDFEERARSGLAGWSWTDVLPFFKEIETDRDFDGSLHGQSGPIPIRRHTMEEWPEFCKAVARVAVKRDLPLVEDMNADPSNGYGRIPMNNLPSQRVSAAMGFLDAAARQRPNLTVMTDVRVERLLCENQRVVGVEVTSGPKAAKFHGRAVFLCAGAIHSPAILMRSGIGPAEALKELGINIVADSPAVGRNLQEHPTVSVAAYLKPFAMQSESLRAHANLGIRMTSPQPWAPYGDIYTSVMAKSSWHALGRRIANFLISLLKPVSRGEV